MKDIKAILVATDFSEHSESALRYAAALADAFGAAPILCHVVPGPDILTQIPPSRETYFPPDFVATQKEEARRLCAEALRRVGRAGDRVVIGEGTPFVEIVRIAREEGADLLVVGTHGRGAVAHALLGSVAEKLVRKSPVPVLTVRDRRFVSER